MAEINPANRTETGRFRTGCSGNPSGRPKRSEAEREAITRLSELTPMALDTLSELMTSETTPAKVKILCCQIVLERVLGKPMEHSDIEDLATTPSTVLEAMREARRPIYG